MDYVDIEALLKPTTINGKLVTTPTGHDIIRMRIAQSKDTEEDGAISAITAAGRAVELCTDYDEGAALQVAAICGVSDPLVKACLERCGLRMQPREGSEGDGEDGPLAVDPSTQQQQQD